NITDFAVGVDHMQLDSSIFSAISSINLDHTLGANQFLASAGMPVATTADQHILFNTLTGALYYDEDGNGAADAVQFATLVGAANLSASSIYVI
ncbi:calcium-binding protein, partial [Novimethylophilus kurashikiensis]